MMRTNHEFSKTTRANLALGNKALWDKSASDPVFREKFYRKRCRGLDKGRQTSMRRTERRCYALFSQVMVPEFGWPSPRTGVNEVIEVLDDYPVFVEKYYSNHSIAMTLKKDLSRLRNEIDVL